MSKVYARQELNVLNSDVEWIAKAGRYVRNGFYRKGIDIKRKGIVNAIGLSADMRGFVFDIECRASYIGENQGNLFLSGFAEKETLKTPHKELERPSIAVCSVKNAMLLLEKEFGLNVRDYNIYINALGGLMVDGPSAGLAMTVLIYSTISGIEIPSDIAFTGEIGLSGCIYAVGGVREKTEAAVQSGVKTVFYPSENTGESDEHLSNPIEVSNVGEVIEYITNGLNNSQYRMKYNEIASASSI